MLNNLNLQFKGNNNFQNNIQMIKKITNEIKTLQNLKQLSFIICKDTCPDIN